MFFSYLALMLGIIGGILLLVIIFSFLTVAQQAEARAEPGFGRGCEEGWEDSQSRLEKVQANEEPFEELVGIPRMSHPGLPH